ncbi:SRPBCC family protein [Streptomyces boncukensis]|uniref:Polyketide cyclase n=1 Tax=Streptomyces boncukensis TaxID=2711219 RepID=A0A6G4WW62_9ACTN|nr:SRPBCC family protein [Streptomyces boncukensis]NGO68860.1 hypothetical protein [Streptomyces boncukensis]
MWNHEVSAEGAVSVSAVWERYVDLATWPQWNPGTTKVELKGPFASGTEGVITNGYGEVPFTLTAVVDQQSFVMESPVNETVLLRTSCRVEAAGDGARITHRVELDGAGAEELGNQMGETLSKNLTDGVTTLSAAG